MGSGILLEFIGALRRCFCCWWRYCQIQSIDSRRINIRSRVADVWLRSSRLTSKDRRLMRHDLHPLTFWPARRRCFSFAHVLCNLERYTHAHTHTHLHTNKHSSHINKTMCNVIPTYSASCTSTAAFKGLLIKAQMYTDVYIGILTDLYLSIVRYINVQNGVVRSGVL